MTKKKNVTEAIAEVNEQTSQERIKELEAKIREGEEKALERVCKAMGLTSTEVKEKEAAKPDERMVRLWVNYPVRVNEKVYQGDVTVPYETFRVISQSLGDRRNRIMREMTGNSYILKELEGGGFAPQLIETRDASGERIA